MPLYIYFLKINNIARFSSGNNAKKYITFLQKEFSILIESLSVFLEYNQSFLLRKTLYVRVAPI